MAHIVKCYYCGKTFDIEKEKYQKPNANRYAHLTCFTHQQNAEGKRLELLEFCKLRMGPIADFHKINAQIKDFNARGISNEEILLAIKYWLDIKKQPVEKTYGGIGIVPYILGDSKNYWSKIKSLRTPKITEEIINIKRIPKRKKWIELDESGAGGED